MRKRKLFLLNSFFLRSISLSYIKSSYKYYIYNSSRYIRNFAQKFSHPIRNALILGSVFHVIDIFFSLFLSDTNLLLFPNHFFIHERSNLLTYLSVPLDKLFKVSFQMLYIFFTLYKKFGLNVFNLNRSALILD